MTKILFRQGAPADDAALRALLDGAGLPSDDVAAERQEFVVAIEDGRIVGSVALELAGPDALIRSLAVAPESRGRGLGAALTDRAVALARRRGVTALYLLTTTAREYALRRGFEPIERGEVPSSIAALPQFRTLCPATAVCMRLRLVRPSGFNR